MAHTTAVKRGCGLRQAGGIYFETGLSAYGRPVTDFLIDPPVPVDLEALGITNVGVHLVEYKGQKVVMDVVGKQHYPNVADFIEEVKHYGVSRRVRESFPFEELGERAVLVLIHANAVIENAADYYTHPGAIWDCPKRNPGHHHRQIRQCLDDYEKHGSLGGAQRALLQDIYDPRVGFPAGLQTCAGLWWRDLPPMDPGDEDFIETIREMPALHYRAHRRPATIVPIYHHGIFAVFPITNLSVIMTDDQKKLQKAVDAASKAGVSYSIDLE